MFFACFMSMNSLREIYPYFCFHFVCQFEKNAHPAKKNNALQVDDSSCDLT